MSNETGKRFFDARTKYNVHNTVKGKPQTIKSVHDDTDIPQSSIALYEDGSRLPNMENAIKLANHYGVNVLWLLGQSDSASLCEDEQTVSKVTGLSDNAIQILQIMKQTELIDSLNRLLESDGFWKMLKAFNSARIINKSTQETEEVSELISKLEQWRTDNGNNPKDNRVSDHQLIDMYLWKATQEISNVFNDILKGVREDGKH